MKKKSSIYKHSLVLTGIIILFLFGIGLFMYPVVCNWYNDHNSGIIISSYDISVNQMNKEQLEVLKSKADEYNRHIAEDQFVDSEGDSMFTIGDVLGYIEIPDIKVYLPICPGTSDDVLSHAAGHLSNSSLPVGGNSTHCVITGHSALPEAKLFTELDKMKIGDVFYIHSFDKVLEYRVEQLKVVLPYDTSDLKVIRDKDYVTLCTCTPYAVNTHRLLVRGIRTN